MIEQPLQECLNNPFSNYKLFIVLMGLITVHLFTVAPSEKQTLQTGTERQTLLNIKDKPNLYQEFLSIAQSTQLSQTQRAVPGFTCMRSPFHKRMAPPSLHAVGSWSAIFGTLTLVHKIIAFLNGQDLLMLKHCSQFLQRESIIKILQKENNWDLTFGVLAPYLLQQTHLKESVAEQDYQHSQDLDRTSGYFESQNSQDLQQHQLKLDRIVTTVSFRIQYFQGIMPICANLLQCFNEHISYWLLRYLLHKCRYIQNDICFYNAYVEVLDNEFKALLPDVYFHLTDKGFQLNYFVMKWIMGLFSEDMSKTMMLALWDLICQTDVFVLIYAIVEIFRILSQDILASKEDQINQMLKINLKQKLANIKSQELMKHIKKLYICRRLDGGYQK